MKSNIENFEKIKARLNMLNLYKKLISQNGINENLLYAIMEEDLFYSITNYDNEYIESLYERMHVITKNI